MVISKHNDKTLKQMVAVQQTKKVINKPKTDPLERKMQDDKPATTETSRPKSWPNKIEVISNTFLPLQYHTTFSEFNRFPQIILLFVIFFHIPIFR